MPKSGDLPSWQHEVHQHRIGLEFLTEPKQLPQGDLQGLSSEFHPGAITKKLESGLPIGNMLGYRALEAYLTFR